MEGKGLLRGVGLILVASSSTVKSLMARRRRNSSSTTSPDMWYSRPRVVVKDLRGVVKAGLKRKVTTAGLLESMVW